MHSFYNNITASFAIIRFINIAFIRFSFCLIYYLEFTIKLFAINIQYYYTWFFLTVEVEFNIKIFLS